MSEALDPVVRPVTAPAGAPAIDLQTAVVDPAALARVPAAVCRRHRVLPVRFEGRRLVVAMADPADVFALDDVRALARCEITPVAADPADLATAVDRHHRTETGLGDLTRAVPAADALEGGDEGAPDATSPVVRFVDAIITQAVLDRASDIHLEPGESEFRIRYRIDGVLHPVLTSPTATLGPVVSRLKIMAGLDIAERRLPQDGRLTVAVRGEPTDLRMATLPTVWGEKVVLRVLDASAVRLDLARLGLRAANHERFSASLARTHGMVLVTGPTGSGKSTTLYAALGVISRPEINVITVEDPVEFRLPGLSQVQVNPKAGLTFASALRSILRSDPDVVLLGEVRDHETAKIAVEASLTGHLVLSTLHTNDAPSAITRLVEMGVEPFLVGSALECVVAQRLARRLCERCKEPYLPAAGDLLAAGVAWSPQGELPVLHRAAGCTACARTGYRGRLALHEVMPVTEEVEHLAATRAPASEIGARARAGGMTTLLDDGWAKVLLGSTTVEEVLRVVR